MSKVRQFTCLPLTHPLLHRASARDSLSVPMTNNSIEPNKRYKNEPACIYYKFESTMQPTKQHRRPQKDGIYFRFGAVC